MRVPIDNPFGGAAPWWAEKEVGVERVRIVNPNHVSRLILTTTEIVDRTDEHTGALRVPLSQDVEVVIGSSQLVQFNIIPPSTGDRGGVA